MSNDLYKHKYLKYKLKYLEMRGGELTENQITEIISQLDNIKNLNEISNILIQNKITYTDID